MLVLVFKHQIKIYPRVHSTVNVIRARIVLMWSVREVTQRVPPTCTRLHVPMGRVPRLLVVEVDGGFQLQRGKHFFRFVGLLLKKKKHPTKDSKTSEHQQSDNISIRLTSTLKKANSIGTIKDDTSVEVLLTNAAVSSNMSMVTFHCTTMLSWPPVVIIDPSLKELQTLVQLPWCARNSKGQGAATTFSIPFSPSVIGGGTWV
jgi:hypothetical protein